MLGSAHLGAQSLHTPLHNTSHTSLHTLLHTTLQHMVQHGQGRMHRRVNAQRTTHNVQHTTNMEPVRLVYRAMCGHTGAQRTYHRRTGAMAQSVNGGIRATTHAHNPLFTCTTNKHTYTHTRIMTYNHTHFEAHTYIHTSVHIYISISIRRAHRTQSTHIAQPRGWHMVIRIHGHPKRYKPRYIFSYVSPLYTLLHTTSHPHKCYVGPHAPCSPFTPICVVCLSGSLYATMHMCIYACMCVYLS